MAIEAALVSPKSYAFGSKKNALSFKMNHPTLDDHVVQPQKRLGEKGGLGLGNYVVSCVTGELCSCTEIHQPQAAGDSNSSM